MSSLQKAFFTQRSSEFNLFHFKVQYCVYADRPDKTDPHLESSNSLHHLYNATLLLMLTKKFITVSLTKETAYVSFLWLLFVDLLQSASQSAAHEWFRQAHVFLR